MRLLSLLTSLLLWQLLFATLAKGQQCAGFTCTPPPYAPSTPGGSQDFSNWDWANQDRCNWITYVNGLPQCVNPPFLTGDGGTGGTPSVGFMADIISNEDYKKEKGWRLISANFNGIRPFFILYNKYTAKVRAYFYTPSTPSLVSYVIACSYGTNDGLAILGTANDPIKALNEYHSGSSNDLILKTIGVSTQDGWVAADFPMMYDPSVSTLQANSNRLRIQLIGVQSGSLSLNGTAIPINSTIEGSSAGLTNTGFNAAAASARLKEFLQSSGELVDALSAEESSIPSNADPSVLALKRKLGDALGNVSGTKAQKVISLNAVLGTVSKVSSIASAAIGIFELFAGNVSEETSPSLAASTSYAINLTGTLEFSTAFAGSEFMIPGTAGNNSKLYACPLGRINLAQTPVFNTSSFSRIPSKGSEWFWAYDQTGYTGTYKKCRLNNDIQLVENIVTDHLGNNLVRKDVKFAIKMKASADRFKESDPDQQNHAWYDILNPIILTQRYKKITNTGSIIDIPIYTYESFTIPNPVKRDIDKGIFIIHKYDEDKGSHTYGTPYMSAEDLKGITFEIPSATDISLTVIATYQNIATGETFVASNNFAIQLTEDTNLPHVSAIEGSNECPNYPLSDFYITPFTYSFNSPYYHLLPLNSTFSASEISMLPGFNSSTGYAAVGRHPYINHGGSLNMTTSYVNGTCGHTQGLKTAAFDQTDNGTEVKYYTIYPNPSNGNVSIDFTMDAKNNTVHVYNNQGLEVLSKTVDEENHVEVNLGDKEPGIYLIKMNSETQNISEKIVLIK